MKKQSSVPPIHGIACNGEVKRPTFDDQGVNLSGFLFGMADGISEQYEALESRHGESVETLALRDYWTQLIAVAEAVAADGSVDWLALEDRIGTETV